MERRRVILISAALLMLLSTAARAQHLKGLGVATNLAGWCNFITMNAEISYPVSPLVTAHLTAKFNPWSFNKEGGGGFQNRILAFGVSARYWDWYPNAGWFAGAGIQYSIFNQGGILKSETREGWAAGINLQVGYALALARDLNLEFAVGFMAAFSKYTIYSCPRCGRAVGNGAHWAIVPNNFIIQIVYLL